MTELQLLLQARSQPIFEGVLNAPRHTAVGRARGWSGRGLPPPDNGGPRVLPPENFFETETSVGVYLRTQKAIF